MLVAWKAPMGPGPSDATACAKKHRGAPNVDHVAMAAALKGVITQGQWEKAGGGASLFAGLDNLKTTGKVSTSTLQQNSKALLALLRINATGLFTKKVLARAVMELDTLQVLVKVKGPDWAFQEAWVLTACLANLRRQIKWPSPS
jgi:hypothetical protein